MGPVGFGPELHMGEYVIPVEPTKARAPLSRKDKVMELSGVLQKV